MQIGRLKINSYELPWKVFSFTKLKNQIIIDLWTTAVHVSWKKKSKSVQGAIEEVIKDLDMSSPGWDDYDENGVPYWEKTGVVDPDYNPEVK